LDKSAGIVKGSLRYFYLKRK